MKAKKKNWNYEGKVQTKIKGLKNPYIDVEAEIISGIMGLIEDFDNLDEIKVNAMVYTR